MKVQEYTMEVMHREDGPAVVSMPLWHCAYKYICKYYNKGFYLPNVGKMAIL